MLGLRGKIEVWKGLKETIFSRRPMLRLEEADLRTQQTNFRFQRADQRSNRADFSPNRTDNRPERAEGWTNELLDRW